MHCLSLPLYLNVFFSILKPIIAFGSLLRPKVGHIRLSTLRNHLFEISYQGIHGWKWWITDRQTVSPRMEQWCCKLWMFALSSKICSSSSPLDLLSHKHQITFSLKYLQINNYLKNLCLLVWPVLICFYWSKNEEIHFLLHIALPSISILQESCSNVKFLFPSPRFLFFSFPISKPQKTIVMWK